MEVLMRTLFLHLAKSRAACRLARKYGLKWGASRFVAGLTIQDAIQTVRRLNEQGKVATLDYLGEFVGSTQEAERSTEMCLRTLDAIASSGVDANLSLKLTSLGLDVDSQLARENLCFILKRAQEKDNFVRIDMEDFAHCQPTIDIFKEMKERFDNVGLVIQAYLYRSERDIQDLAQLNPNLRLVKGAYKESEEVAYPKKSDVDRQFIKLIRAQLHQGYTAVATHDRNMIDIVRNDVRKQQIELNRFEFQMLYGIGEDVQDELVREGYKVRVYVPYGEDWYGYFMRRLAERPANVWFVLKNLWK